MKFTPFSALIAVCLVAGPAVAADPVTGTWRSEGDKITFKASYCGKGEQLCATLLKMDDNTVPILAPFVGQKVTVKSTQLGEHTWRVTPVVAAGLISATVTVTRPGRIDVKGCLGSDCRNLGFRRIAD